MNIPSVAYRGIHDSDAVRPNGISDVTNVDRVQILVVACFLNKYLSDDNYQVKSSNFHHHQLNIRVKSHVYLIIQVVQVFGNEDVNVSHDNKHIHSLW